jgi:uncharacterized protein (DUF1800 family)
MEKDGLHAVRRFGFGRRGMEPVPDDPQYWIASQLDTPDPLLAQPGPSILTAALADRAFQTARKDGMVPNGGMAALHDQEMTALMRHAVDTDLPARERLVWFWSNHFTVSSRAGEWSMGLLGAYVQEAIRPHVTGRFVDLVRAVMRHPAMLYYLNNVTSVGPNSAVGLKQHLGVNENLARECLELHTLGVQSGYTQQDVTAFAAILSGRSFERNGDAPGFVFRADWHEPGAKTFMGRTYLEGFDASEAALSWIAEHPATRRHIATQLVQHFVADVPPPQCVARVETVLRDTDGDLKQAVLAIAGMKEAWQPLTKIRAPAEYVIAVQRALDLPPQPADQLRFAARDLGQQFMGPLLPNGWPDTADDWIFGEALLKRADWAMTRATRSGAPAAEVVATATLGGRCSQSTLSAIRACPNKAEALATLLASPEFMRR